MGSMCCWIGLAWAASDGSSGDPHLGRPAAGGAPQDGATPELHLSSLVVRTRGGAGRRYGDDGCMPFRLACCGGSDRNTVVLYWAIVLDGRGAVELTRLGPRAL